MAARVAAPRRPRASETMLPRLARRLPCRRLSTSAAKPWHVAIIGSGPAGFYTADFLLKGDPDVRVDIFERLPVPFGLVRYGVAPDHQTVKNVTDRFGQIASDPRCSLLANVRVGDGDDPTGVAASVPLAKVREQYHAVVLACGADTDRTLGLPGEELEGVHSARQFVEWYNGHPRAVGRTFGLAGCETAVIVGHGNVALDCARMLCSTPDQLVGETDVASHAVAELSASGVRQVVLLGRRGVLHAAFTIKELRELSKRAGATMRLSAPPDAFSEAVLAAAAADRPRKRLIDLMHKLHDPDVADPPPPPPSDEDRAIRVQFQRVPIAFRDGGGDGRLRAVQVQATALEGEPAAGQRAAPISGSEYDLPCGLALRAVGYKSSPIDGAPFDAARGVVPCGAGGRVEGGAGQLYATGWLKRGPNGVILTNVTDAQETAQALLADRAAGSLSGEGRACGGGDAVRDVLSGQGRPLVDFDGWSRIDEVEVARGVAAGKVREKLVDVHEMLDVAMSK